MKNRSRARQVGVIVAVCSGLAVPAGAVAQAPDPKPQIDEAQALLNETIDGAQEVDATALGAATAQIDEAQALLTETIDGAQEVDATALDAAIETAQTTVNAAIDLLEQALKEALETTRVD